MQEKTTDVRNLKEAEMIFEHCFFFQWEHRRQKDTYYYDEYTCHYKRHLICVGLRVSNHDFHIAKFVIMYK